MTGLQHDHKPPLNGTAQYMFPLLAAVRPEILLLASMPHTACCQADHQVVTADFTELPAWARARPRHVAQNGIHRTKAPAVIKLDDQRKVCQRSPALLRRA